MTTQPHSTVPATADPNAWEIVKSYAEGNGMLLPEVEHRLQTYLGSQYQPNEWQAILGKILEAEDETEAAVAKEYVNAQAAAMLATHTSAATSRLVVQTYACTLELKDVEKDLMDATGELRTRQRIIGTAPTLEDLLNPIEEKEKEDSPYRFEGGDTEIIAQLQQEQVVECGKAMAVDDTDSEGAQSDAEMNPKEVMRVCEQLERMCLSYAHHKETGELAHHLRRFRGRVWKEAAQAQKQVTLEHFWRVK
jgi:hypothetical protein